MIAYTYPLADLFGTMLGLFVFFIWFWLLIVIFWDIFRSQDLGGGAKMLWVLFVIILPFLGIFIYLIARGGKMHERAAAQAAQQQTAFDDYVKKTAGREPTRRSSCPSWPTCASKGSSPMPSSKHRRRRSWPEPDGPSYLHHHSDGDGSPTTPTVPAATRGDNRLNLHPDEARSLAVSPTNGLGHRSPTKRRMMYYIGGIVFAAMAIVLVVVFVRKFRQSND